MGSSLEDEEVAKLLHQASTLTVPVAATHTYVRSGANGKSFWWIVFYHGRNDKIKNPIKQREKISISILGRLTAVKLGFDQIEIIEE